MSFDWSDAELAEDRYYSSDAIHEEPVMSTQPEPLKPVLQPVPTSEDKGYFSFKDWIKTSKPLYHIADYNWLLYGLPKVGKTSFALNFEAPLLLTFGHGEEPKHLECDYLLLDTKKSEGRQEMQRLRTVLNALRSGKHQYKTVILDTIDGLFSLIGNEICLKAGADSLTDKGLGFGKGTDQVKKEIIEILNALRGAGSVVVAISHAIDKDNYVGDVKVSSKVQTSLSEKVQAEIIKWFDFIAYFQYSALDQSKREIVLNGNNSLLAGGRFPSGVSVPDRIPLDYQALKALFDTAQEEPTV